MSLLRLSPEEAYSDGYEDGARLCAIHSEAQTPLLTVSAMLVEARSSFSARAIANRYPFSFSSLRLPYMDGFVAGYTFHPGRRASVPQRASFGTWLRNRFFRQTFPQPKDEIDLLPWKDSNEERGE